LKRYQWVDYFRTDGRKRLLMGMNMRVQGLGADVSPVITEDSRQRGTRAERVKEAVLEEPKREPLVQNLPVSPKIETKSEKSVQAKPFTRILDPSRLSPQKTPAKTDKQPNTKRWLFGAGGLALIGIFIFGLYVFSPPPSELKPTSTPILAEHTITPVPPTATPAPATETPQLTLTLGIGSTIVSEKDGMVMVYVPAGDFTIGSNDGYDSERPEHQIHLDAFWIDQTEVTNFMYAKCVGDNDCTSPSSSSSFTRDFYYGNSEFDDYPVIYVDWNQAKNYCSWAGRELPTEAEWEKAARGTDGRTYPWGEEIDCDKANYYLCTGDTSPVGSYEGGKSIYGVYDMVGNVNEWVSSLPMGYPYDADDGREDLSASGARVLRGGSWFIQGYVYSAYRNNQVGPGLTDISVGFRCALSQP
jgi:serine/threonine-protein kinase